MTGKAKHGLSYTPEYRVWQTMRLRCTEPSNPAWKDYGGRGITICRQWLDSPEQFLADLGPKPSAAHMARRVLRDTLTHEQRGNAINMAATELFEILRNSHHE